MRHRAALLSVLATTVATLIATTAAPASAVVRGFDVKITELPRSFSAGSGPGTITVVASTDVGRVCQKVRWSMLMEVDGVDLEDIRVQRVEDSGSFPLQVQSEGDTARLTDTQLDPGELCVGRTVTARYEVSFADDADKGEVRFQAEVFDARQRLLQRAAGTSTVSDGDGRQAEPKPTEDAEPSPQPTESEAPDDDNSRDAEVDQPQDEATEPAASPSDSAIAAVPAGNSGNSNLVGVGLIIGALLMFMGVGLLLRLRLRSRNAPGALAMTRTYNPMP